MKIAEIKLSYNPSTVPNERVQVSCSKDAYGLFIEQWDENLLELQEQFKVMLLNRSNHVLGIFELSKGGIAGTVADLRLIFGTALKAVASSIILAHNHPSGNLSPSTADIELTRKLTEAGKLLEIPILDHLIITAYGYYSMADEGEI